MSAALSADELARIAADQVRLNAEQIRLGAIENALDAEDLRRATDRMPKPTIDGAVLLQNVQAYIGKFCVFPDEHCLIATTLWAAHSHMVEHFHTTPRLALLSPEPGSGKTRVLEVLNLLV